MMLDYFAMLGVSRRASMSLDEARAAFQSRGAAVHPDAAADAVVREARAGEFQLLNEAFSVLSARPRRLRHLLELAGGQVSKGAVLDESLMGVFSLVNQALQQADAFLTKSAMATSALAKALLTGEALATEEVLAAAAQQLVARQEILEVALAEMDANGLDLAKLQRAAQEAAFLEKWELQVQQRRLRLLN
jgi:curved DNA-binding protein CbpA